LDNVTFFSRRKPGFDSPWGVTKFSLFKKLLCSLLLAQIGQGGWVMNE